MSRPKFWTMVPSGWDVDSGPLESADTSLQPDVLVSLMLPKLCAKAFQGRAHYLGKVLLPGRVAVAHGRRLERPAFQGAEQIVRLS